MKHSSLALRGFLKKKKLILIIPLVFFLNSCEQQEVVQEIDASDFQLKNGIYYAFNEEEPYSGRVTEFHPNGQLSTEMTVLNGLPDGLAQRWYENGQLMGALTFVNGKPDGLNRWWHENGQLKLESTFVNGEGNGVSRQWHEDGRVKSETCYKDGESADMSYCHE